MLNHVCHPVKPIINWLNSSHLVGLSLKGIHEARTDPPIWEIISYL